MDATGRIAIWIREAHHASHLQLVSQLGRNSAFAKLCVLYHQFVLQALEQGALMAAGLPTTTSKQANESQSAVASGGAATGTVVGGAGGSTVSRWVWPPLSSEELAVQAAREGGMVAVDDEMDVGEVLRLADE